MTNQCNCGNYLPYKGTMEPGVIYAPCMPMDACVNCTYTKPISEESLNRAMKRVKELRGENNGTE